MSEKNQPFMEILLRDTNGFLHVSGCQNTSILVDSSFFLDLLICD